MQQENQPTHPQEKKDPKESWSRNAKREGNRLEIFLNKLIYSYVNFYQTHSNKQSEELVKAFDDLDKKWKNACNKKWDSIAPKKEAFATNIDRILSNIKKIEEQRAKTALKSA